MLEILGTLVGGIFSGGATGIIGVIAQRFADYKNKQLDMQLEAQRHANAVALREVDAKIMQQEAAAKIQVVELETAGASDVADAQAFAASYALEPKRFSSEAQLTVGQNWVMVALDALRGSVRPLLTIYLCVLVTAIYIEARLTLRANGGELSPEQALDLFKLMLGTICYVWTTVTLWWFGTRNRSTQPSLK